MSRVNHSNAPRLAIICLSLILMALTLPLSIALPAALIHRPQESTDSASLEALIETSRGQIVIEFFPNEAPKHVEYFVKQARAGAYDGTTFHRAVKYALIQGGDPLSKNAAAKSRYGTGGLNAGLPDEVNKNKHVGGAVSAALQLVAAGSDAVKSGSSGQQFFIVLNASTAQAKLDAQFTVFGNVVEGLNVVQDISGLPTSASGMISERIVIQKVTIREKTPTLEQMKAMTMTMETSLGNLKLQFTPEHAPNATRLFIRNARSGMYDETALHRVSQKYFIEGGSTETWPPESANRKRAFSYWPVPFEKNDGKHTRGTLLLRQTGEGLTFWYYALIATDNPGLDGKNSPIAKVVEGLDVLDKIAAVEVEGDKPKQRIEVKKITIQ